ncbi:Uncharacterized protein SCF082_LOCUS36030 [Durusdinium trenchii]|uniref:Uncharacterized protein n=1 Tax=Durusdinium trenchii TaxID=1381693 RepID=A0ABP0PF86_9DINO
MDQLPRLEEGLRLRGAAWLERRLSSFNKEALIAIAASLNVLLSEGCHKNDITNTLLTKFQCAEDIVQLQRLAAERGPARLHEKLAKFGVLELKRMDEHIGVSSSCAPQAVCFRHPADVRLATAGRKPGGAKSNVPIATQGALCQFQALACQPALRRKYSEASRPMIKQIARLENQRATGMVFPIACPHEDLLFSSFGAKLRALAVFPNYITVLARAEDEEPKLVETGTGDDKVIMLQYEKVLLALSSE